jgi:hypothetical protein
MHYVRIDITKVLFKLDALLKLNNHQIYSLILIAFVSIEHTFYHNVILMIYFSCLVSFIL